MNYDKRDMQKLKNEDIIWYIYFLIVIFALLANKYEEDYLVNKNYQDKIKGRKINIVLLIVAFFIYLYFTNEAIEDLRISKMTNTGIRKSEERLITTLTFLAAGTLAIYTELDDNSTDIDLAIF